MRCVLAFIATASAFVSRGAHLHALSGGGRSVRLRAHPAFKAKVDPRYTLEKAVEAGEAGKDANVPQTFDEVKFEMQTSVAAAVSSSAATRFVVECLPPGLNPELEGTVPYSPSRELAVLFALLETLPNARVAMPSSGDAAMAARAFEGSGLDATYCGLGGASGAGKDPAGVVARVFGDAEHAPDFIVVVRPKNSVGDAVIEDVMTVVEAAEASDAAVILLNPDLAEKVALGIRQKDAWARFAASFEPAYHFSNLCTFERPSMRQMERGACRYVHGRGWEVFHCIPLLDTIHGDLRRYGSFEVDACRPWPFVLASADGAARPSRDDLAQRVAHGAKLAKILREAQSPG